MKFKFKNLGLSSGDIKILVMTDDDAFILGAKPGDRVRIYHISDEGSFTGGTPAIIDIATADNIIENGTVGFYDETFKQMNLQGDELEVEVQLSSKPPSFDAIKKKIAGKKLSTKEINEIINDCTEGNLLPIEMAAFITALQIHGAEDDEVVDLTLAMAKSGEIVDFGPEVYDKHSTGGVPGNKVTLIIVPIAAAAGLFIPKTSTRAITSPSGTADSMEALAPVTFNKDQILEMLKTEKALILWGGAFDSAPADNILIGIEKPLNMDPLPLMIASIICKKMAMGIKKMVLDIPVGPGTKFPTQEDGRKFALRFKDIAKRVGIEAVCALTQASQPIGHFVGPSLEAVEALRLLRDFNAGPSSLLNKSVELAGLLLELAGKAAEGTGKDMAIDLLQSGKAYEAMKQIIRAQGGNPDITPEEIEVGPYIEELHATHDGHITSIDNEAINRIAKIAGCPAARKAGIEIVYKNGAAVKKDEVIFRIFSDSKERLAEAVKYYNQHPPQILGGMTLEKV